MPKYLCSEEVQHCGTCPACARNAQASKSPAMAGSISLQDVAEIVCRHLPVGYQIAIMMEKDAAWVDLLDSHGNSIDFDDVDRLLYEQVNEALCNANGFGEAEMNPNYFDMHPEVSHLRDEKTAMGSASPLLAGYVEVVGYCDGSHPEQEHECDYAIWHGDECYRGKAGECIIGLGTVYKKST